MELLEHYRYSIYMKTGYKILCTVFALVAIAMVVLATMMAMEQVDDLFVTILRILLVLFFVSLSVMQILVIRKRVDVYKGKILYCNGFQTKTYKLSEIYKSNTAVEVTRIDSYHKSYDYVTTFYDRSGKKLFKFGTAFKNIDLLESDVKKTRKSMANNKQRTRKPNLLK